MVKIEFNKEECIACGACVSVSKNWKINEEENKAEPLKTEISDEEVAENKEAAEVCPINCIKVVESPE